MLQAVLHDGEAKASAAGWRHGRSPPGISAPSAAQMFGRYAGTGALTEAAVPVSSRRQACAPHRDGRVLGGVSTRLENAGSARSPRQATAHRCPPAPSLPVLSPASTSLRSNPQGADIHAVAGSFLRHESSARVEQVVDQAILRCVWRCISARGARRPDRARRRAAGLQIAGHHRQRRAQLVRSLATNPCASIRAPPGGSRRARAAAAACRCRAHLIDRCMRARCRARSPAARRTPALQVAHQPGIADQVHDAHAVIHLASHVHSRPAMRLNQRISTGYSG